MRRNATTPVRRLKFDTITETDTRPRQRSRQAAAKRTQKVPPIRGWTPTGWAGRPTGMPQLTASRYCGELESVLVEAVAHDATARTHRTLSTAVAILAVAVVVGCELAIAVETAVGAADSMLVAVGTMFVMTEVTTNIAVIIVAFPVCPAAIGTAGVPRSALGTEVAVLVVFDVAGAASAALTIAGTIGTLFVVVSLAVAMAGTELMANITVVAAGTAVVATAIGALGTRGGILVLEAWDGQGDLAVLVDALDDDLDLIAFLEHVLDALDAPAVA